MKQHHSDSEIGGPETKLPSVSPYEINIRGYLDALIEGKFMILLIGLSVTVMAMLYLIIATPIFSSDVLLQFIDRGSASAVLGEISDALTTENSVVDAEAEIIKSRRILGSVVEELKLGIIIEPKTFPVIGKFLLRRKMKSQGEPAPAPSDWGGGVQHWGDNEIAIDSLEVGSRYVGKRLTLVPGEGGKYELFGPSLFGSALLEGEVGKRQVVGKSPNGGDLSPAGIDILISALDVEPGTEYYVTRKTLQGSLAGLLDVLKITEEGKDTNLLRMSMEGENPRHIAKILNKIAANYLEYSAGKRAKALQYMIDFVQKEILLSKQKLERAETALVQYLFEHNSAGLSSEITQLMSRLSSIESQISELEISKVGLQAKYTDDYPEIVTVTRKIQLLESEKADIDQRLKQLPESEREKEALSRDVETAKELLILLQSKEQELGVALAGAANNFQIVDPAQVASAPTRPNRLVVMGAGIILGFFLGLLYVTGRRALYSGIEDPDVIENELQMPVNAVIVFSRLQASLERDRKGRGGNRHAGILATHSSSDPAIEGLRGLCANIRLFQREGLNNVINISSPAPNTGVSFIGANLSQLLADSGMDVLLVDADLRGGKTEKAFGVSQAPGLTDYLQGSCELEDVVHKISESDSGTLNFMARGASVNNSAELLMTDRFAEFVDSCNASYGMVIFVTPPVTAFTDGVIVSSYADRNFLVVRYGKQSKREIKAAQKIYKQAGIETEGVIFNGMIERRRDGYSYSYRRAY